MHRGDFHQSLHEAIGTGIVHFGKRLADFSQTEGGVRLRFHDGSAAAAEIAIGADGSNSMVRAILTGPSRPSYAGHVAHRAVIPASRLQGLRLDDCAKWWSADRHIVVYYLTRARDEICLVTGVPQQEWNVALPYVRCPTSELLAAFEGYHADILALIQRCPELTKWPLLELSPRQLWHRERVILLGDACHAMKPHMAQGAAMAIEDAAMLTRCLKEVGVDRYADAFQLYEASRVERTSKVQQGSRNNTWLRDGADGDPTWVFDYDAFTVPLYASVNGNIMSMDLYK
jgi:6-hydroxynicotinate 3-monooxygenase